MTVSPQAVLLCHECFWQRHYGSNHPLSIPRVSLAVDLMRAYGALESAELVVATAATDEQLQWFHHIDYIQALRESEQSGGVRREAREQFNFGNLENPFFRLIFTAPAIATGASIQGAECVLGGQMAFNPAGGMHHGQPRQARGFCFFNDPVLAIIRFRLQGWRVLYLDLDAHHGDGVETAFVADPDVLTVSLHMDTQYAYPFVGGGLYDWGRLGNAVNIPLPMGCNDAEYHLLFDRIWQPILTAFSPDVIVVQAGTDALMADPLGKLRLTTQGFLAVLQAVLASAPRHSTGVPKVLVLGGGGYQPLALARCWVGVWGLLSGRALPEAMPPEGAALLRAVGWDLDEDEEYFAQLFTSRLDHESAPSVRANLLALAGDLLARHPLWQTPTPV